MADNVLVPISGGTATLGTRDRLGTGTGLHSQITAPEQPAATTGTLGSTTATVSVPVANYGSTTITISGTHAGISVVFEVSDDGANTWFPWAMIRETDGASVGLVNGAVSPIALVANSSNIYITDLPGVTHIRVRATAWTSGGTNSVRVTPFGGALMPMTTIGNLDGNTPAAGSGTLGTTSSAAFAANPARRGMVIRNPSNVSAFILYTNAGTAATTANASLEVKSGQTYEMGTNRYLGAATWIASSSPSVQPVVTEW